MQEQIELMLPPEPPGLLTWMRKNLFNTWFNTIITFVVSAGLIWSIIQVGEWLIFDADFTPVFSRPLLYLVGQYPKQHIWRLGIALFIFSILLGISTRKWGGVMRTLSVTYSVFLFLGVFWPSGGSGITLELRSFLVINILLLWSIYLFGKKIIPSSKILTISWMISLILTLFLVSGFHKSGPFELVSTSAWGGVLVTLFLAIGGITLSFPIGVLLALGRRSSLPVVKIFSIIFIEGIRGVPLISILFLSSIILPLFLPPGIRIDRLFRALAGMTIFSAAYMAENVRGGLAAVPSGQVEAAKAVGLNNFYITTTIVLPQALRAVIPPIVGQFISLFKDTTLASGVAILELLSVGRSILQADPVFIELQMEVFLFIAAIFWIFSFLMSSASQRLEVALGVGVR